MKDIVIFFLVFACTHLFAQTIVSTDITTDTTWTIGGSPYIINAAIEVNPGVELNIDPGVNIQFNSNYSITARGKVQLLGTLADSVILTGLTSSGSMFFDARDSIIARYTVFRNNRSGISTQNAPTQPYIDLAHCSFDITRSALNLNNPANNGYRARIDSCKFEGWAYESAISGTFFQVSNSVFTNTNPHPGAYYRGIRGSSIIVENCSFFNLDGVAISASQPFQIHDNTFEDLRVGLELILFDDDPGATVSSVIGNDILEVDKSFVFLREQVAPDPINLTVVSNTSCLADTLIEYRERFYNPAPSFSLLDVSNNCWCEWDSASISVHVVNLDNYPLNFLPFDSTCNPGQVFPGDANHDQVANNMDLLSIGIHFGETGFSRPNASLNWIGQYADDWAGVQFNGQNVKHADSDGNGIIEEADTLAILQNYGQTHNNLRLAGVLNGPMLTYDMPNDGISKGDTLIVPITFGTVDTPSVNTYGLAFTVTYDTAIIDSSDIRIDFSNSWLGTKGVDMLSLNKDFYGEGRLDIAMTRNNQQPITGSGLLANLIIVISEDLAKKSPPLTLGFKDVLVVDEWGTPQPVITRAATTDFKTNANIHMENPQNIHIYPNPSSSQLHIKSDAFPLTGAFVYNLSGREMLHTSFTPALKQTIDTQHVAAGMYILEVHTTDGVHIQKFIVK